jgi:endonuclease III-like uncharacterized protein
LNELKRVVRKIARENSQNSRKNHLLVTAVGKFCNNRAQCQQTLVNVTTFTETNTFSSCMTDTF